MTKPISKHSGMSTNKILLLYTIYRESTGVEDDRLPARLPIQITLWLVYITKLSLRKVKLHIVVSAINCNCLVFEHQWIHGQNLSSHRSQSFSYYTCCVLIQAHHSIWASIRPSDTCSVWFNIENYSKKTQHRKKTIKLKRNA